MNNLPFVQKYSDIFNLADTFQYSAQLFFAYSEGIFEILESHASAQSIAESKGWITWKTTVFLDGLVALGLLEKNDKNYHNTPASSQALFTGSKCFIGDLIEHERLQWNLWGNMESILKTDKATTLQQDIRLNEESYALDIFHKAMQQLATDLLPEVITLPHWKNSKFVLDLAGGHGMYLIHLALTYPELKGEVWDLEEARALCEQLINQHQLGNRLRFITKDLTKLESFKDVRCDAVMLNHCLHHFSPEEVYGIFRNIESSLIATGFISIVEATLNEDHVSPPSNALFSTYMMINRRNGQLHPTNWISEQLNSIGFSVSRRDLDSLEHDSLLIASR